MTFGVLPLETCTVREKEEILCKFRKDKILNGEKTKPFSVISTKLLEQRLKPK